MGTPETVICTFRVKPEAAERAHDHPDVADIWEAMQPCCESRHGLPAMEFPHFRPHTLVR